MSDRRPATDKGTADRIEADDGGYWVRLVTKQALRREGVCMGNCLDSQGYGQHLAGNEDMPDDGLWSLRKADGLSYLLIELNDLCSTDTRTARVENAAGPMNSQPSGWSISQLRHLMAAFRDAGSTLRIPETIALTDTDGLTWRPDKAPTELRAAYEERTRIEREQSERRRQEMHAERVRRAEQRRGGLLDGEVFEFRSLTEAIIGNGPRSARHERLDAVQWVAMHYGMPWIDHSVEISMASQSSEVLRARIEIDRGGSPVAHDMSPWTERALEEIRERHSSPAPTFQERLMTGFAQASLLPGPRAREPPTAYLVPGGYSQARFEPERGLGLLITPDFVRRARAYRSAVGTLQPVWNAIRDRVVGSRNSA